MMPLNERQRVERIKKRIESGGLKLRQLEELGHSNYGEYHIAKREFDDARKDMERFLRTVKSNDIRAEYSRYTPRKFAARIFYTTLESIGLY